jgi:hypothetical protein
MKTTAQEVSNKHNIVINDLLAGHVRVTFKKADGSTRIGRFTMKHEDLAPVMGTKQSTLRSGTLRVTEILENGGKQWRSFRLERMISAKPYVQIMADYSVV